MLNPSIFFRPLFTKRLVVTSGLMTFVMRLALEGVREKIREQRESYKNATSEFGMTLARQPEKLNPAKS